MQSKTMGDGILVVGGGGQLADAISRKVSCTVLSRSDLDVTNRRDVMRAVVARRPDVVINAAGYTAVDRAESEENAATRVNRDGPQFLAEACLAIGALFVHVSTDFVFDGRSSRPILTEETPNPISAYGRSKWEGELACRNMLGEQALIVRTAWVYASGHFNFVTTMLRLMRSSGTVRVVSDQIGTPTWASTLAEGILALISAGARGTFHLTDSGVASWYDFAVAIQEIGLVRGLLERPVFVEPIRTMDYVTAAERPAYSVLDKTSTFERLGGPTPHWRQSLDRCLGEWEDPK